MNAKRKYKKPEEPIFQLPPVTVYKPEPPKPLIEKGERTIPDTQYANVKLVYDKDNKLVARMNSKGERIPYDPTAKNLTKEFVYPKLQNGGIIPNPKRKWTIMQDGGDVPKGIPNYIWQQVPEKDKQAYRDNPQAAEQWYKQMLSSKSGYTPIDKTEDKTAGYWSKGEQYKRNLKELGNIGLHIAKIPLQAGAIAAGVEMLSIPLVVKALNSAFIGYGAIQIPETLKAIKKAIDTGSKEDIYSAIEKAGWNVIDFLGVGEMKAGTKLLGQDIKNISKFLTEETVLKNTYKLNPYAFKPKPNAYYHRSKDLKNIINTESGMLHGFGESEAGKLFNETAGPKKGFINLVKPANSKLYFSKGVPLDYGRYNSIKKGMSGQGYKGPYIVEIENVPMGASVKGRKPSLKEPSNMEGYAISHRPISIDEAKFYKEDWLKGYKEINVQPSINKKDFVYPKLQEGGVIQNNNTTMKSIEKPPFDEWYKTVPQDKNDTINYRLSRAYELAPQEQLDAFTKNPKAHLYSAYINKQTGNYEFMKSKNHPTIKKELDWYNSKEASKFREQYELYDDGTDYYQYRRKLKNGLNYGFEPGGKWQIEQNIQGPSHEQGGIPMRIYKQNVEVEGGEIAIKNSHGDIAIIPIKEKRNLILNMQNGNNLAIDEMVSKLPKVAERAEEGLVVDEPPTSLPAGIQPSDTIGIGATSEQIYEAGPINVALKDKTSISRGALPGIGALYGGAVGLKVLQDAVNKKVGYKGGNLIGTNTLNPFKASPTTIIKRGYKDLSKTKNLTEIPTVKVYSDAIIEQSPKGSKNISQAKEAVKSVNAKYRAPKVEVKPDVQPATPTTVETQVTKRTYIKPEVKKIKNITNPVNIVEEAPKIENTIISNESKLGYNKPRIYKQGKYIDDAFQEIKTFGLDELKAGMDIPKGSTVIKQGNKYFIQQGEKIIGKFEEAALEQFIKKGGKFAPKIASKLVGIGLTGLAILGSAPVMAAQNVLEPVEIGQESMPLSNKDEEDMKMMEKMNMTYKELQEWKIKNRLGQRKSRVYLSPTK